MFWRLKWAARQMIDRSGYVGHTSILNSSRQFYAAMFRKLVPGLSPAVINLPLKDGHVIPVPEFMSLYIYKEIFVDHCYDVTINRPAPVILDIGANTGLFALRMKQLFPQAEITCYEPFPANFEQLTSTIKMNKLTSVLPVKKAVGAKGGTAKLYIHKRNVGGHSMHSSIASSSDYVEVEVVSLHSILAQLPRVDLLKADCEGAEFDILMSLTALHACKIDQIIVEPTPKLYDIKVLTGHLLSLKYEAQFRKGLLRFTRWRAVS